MSAMTWVELNSAISTIAATSAAPRIVGRQLIDQRQGRIMHIEPAVDGVMLDEARDALALVGVVPLMGNEDTGLHGGHDRGGNLLEEAAKRLFARGFEPMRVRGQVGEAPDQFLPRPRIFDRPVESIGKTPRLNLAPVESDHVSRPR